MSDTIQFVNASEVREQIIKELMPLLPRTFGKETYLTPEQAGSFLSRKLTTINKLQNSGLLTQYFIGDTGPYYKLSEITNNLKPVIRTK